MAASLAVLAVAGGTVGAVGGTVATMDAQRTAGHESRDALLRAQEKLDAPPPIMPIADGEATALAKKRSLASQVARRGRASTVLSSPEDVLGG